MDNNSGEHPALVNFSGASIGSLDDRLLIDNNGFYIVSIDGFYINLGGSVSGGNDPVQESQTAASIGTVSINTSAIGSGTITTNSIPVGSNSVGNDPSSNSMTVSSIQIATFNPAPNPESGSYPPAS